MENLYCPLYCPVVVYLDYCALFTLPATQNSKCKESLYCPMTVYLDCCPHLCTHWLVKIQNVKNI